MPEDKVTTSTTTLRSSAIRQAVLRRNHFFACSRIEIQNKNFGRTPDRRIATRHSLQAASFVVVDCLAAVAQTIGAAVGLMVGLAVTVLLVVIPLVIAGYLLSTESSSVKAGAFLLNQSWEHYVGWMLCCVTAFLCPYLLLGIPMGLSLCFFWPIRGLFAAKKAHRQLRRHRDNNDPSARMQDNAASHHFNANDGPVLRLIKVLWWVILRITVLICGILTLVSFAMLYLKLGAVCLKQDALPMMILGGVMLYGLRFPYAFLHSRMGIGAIDHLINSLFQGEPYRQALGQTLGSMGVI
jgi:hypothetical protein